MEKVTRENCEILNRFEHVTVKNADGSRARARRNGKTKLWKTRNPEFSIPIKIGLRSYYYITDKNCNNWEGE